MWEGAKNIIGKKKQKRNQIDPEILHLTLLWGLKTNAAVDHHDSQDD